MSVYDLQFNKDDVLFRNVIIGTLSALHDKLCWFNTVSDSEKELVNIPFFFSTTGDERFLQDHFLNDITYDADNTIAETVYNQIPRAIVELGGIEVDPGGLSSQSVRGNYEKIVEDGTSQSYNAEFIPIPLRVSLEVTILVDSTLDQFKAVESIIRNVYSNNVFQIDVGGIRIPCSFDIPNSTSQERTIEFREGTTDKKETKVVFSIDVEVNYPVFKNAKNGFVGAADTEMFNGNRMVHLSVFDTFSSQGASGQGVIAPTGSTGTSNVYISN